MKTEANGLLEKTLTQAREIQPTAVPLPPSFGGVWKGFHRAGQDWSAVTKVSADVLREVGEHATRVPAGFTIHPKLKARMESRLEMSLGKAPIDWGAAEMLALGSLLLEGTPVRFVGQDTQRGTFSHRHAALRDYNTGDKYVPLANI